MVDIYETIISDLVNHGKKKGQLLILENVEYIFHNFKRYPFLESIININIDKKIKYIQKHYYSGKIIKKNPCIESVNKYEIIFRSSRLFPTLYCDLLVISKLPKGVYKLKFKKIFIGYHILALHYLYPSLSSDAYDAVLEHWNNRFKLPFKLDMLEKYRIYLLYKGIIK